MIGKIIIILVGVLLVLVGASIFFGMRKFNKEAENADPIELAKLIKEKSKTKDAAFSSSMNRKPLINLNNKALFPIASINQLFILMAYANKVVEGELDPAEKIDRAELAKYHLPKTDSNAHSNWLNESIRNNDILLDDVAKGMIHYGSNANADYLYERLSRGAIAKQEEALNMKQEILPITPQLYLPIYLQNEEGMSQAEAFDSIEAMSEEEYSAHTMEVFTHLMTSPLSKGEKKRVVDNLSMHYQKLWTGKLSKSSTSDYDWLMGQLSRHTLFEGKVHEKIDALLGQYLPDPKLKRYVQKGGTTAYVICLASYGETETNNIELVYFFKNLNTVEQAKIRPLIKKFQIEFMTRPEFRQEVKEILK